MMKKIACLFLIVLLLVPMVHSASASDYDGKAVLDRAVAELCKPYAWGTFGPQTYDAAGLVSYCVTGVHALFGTTFTFLNWPRVDDPQPGDICVSTSHCGIYTGGGQMIHAPKPGTVVSYGPVQAGMIIVRPQTLPDLPDLPPTGDSTPVVPLALCATVSLGVSLLLTRKKKA